MHFLSYKKGFLLHAVIMMKIAIKITAKGQQNLGLQDTKSIKPGSTSSLQAL